MKKFSFFLILILSSCQLFDKKVPDENVLLQKELEKINWDEVDEYPSISNCDSLQDLEQQKQCFFNFLTTEIHQRISTDSLQNLFPNLDTIQLKISILPNNTNTFEVQIANDSLNYLYKADSVFQKKLVHFPLIKPATKRGLKVKTQFILPIIIKKN